MTRRKAVFLDVDGTLVNRFGRVPPSAADAVRQARARGHRMFLCTGRSPAELWPEILDIGFDGMVTCAGAYVVASGEVLAERFVPRQDLRHVIDFFGDRGVEVYFQADNGIYGTPGVQARLRDLVRGSITDAEVLGEFERGLFRFIDNISDADPLANRITKVLYMDADLPIDEIRAEFAGAFDVVPSSVPLFGPNSGEMMIPGVHKAAGIDVVTRHLGIDLNDTLAIGDSYNDLEMLAHVAIGIAMGGAPAPVREAADESTTGVDEDGIRLAFVRHGLIEADAPARG